MAMTGAVFFIQLISGIGTFIFSYYCMLGSSKLIYRFLKSCYERKKEEEEKCFDADPAALTGMLRAPVTQHNSVTTMRADSRTG